MPPEPIHQEPMRERLVRLPAVLDDRLRAHAAASDRTIAATVRRAVQQYLDREETPS